MSDLFPLQIIALFCLSLLVTYFLIHLLVRLPLIRFFTDRPGERKVHQRIIPRIGGVCIVSSFLLFLFLWHQFIPEPFPVLPPHLLKTFAFAAVCILAVGIPDDSIVLEISNRAKLLLELIIAGVIVFLVGIQLDEVMVFGNTYTLGLLGAGISIFWMAGVTNAVNIIDGVDGLAGWISILAFATLGILSWHVHATATLALCVLLAGLIAGFMLHNIPPARVFLGDTGSLFIGMVLGILTIYVVTLPETPYSVFVAPLVVGFPILDVFVAMGRRFTKHVLAGNKFTRALGSMMVPDNEHLHHRLLQRGLSHSETCLILAIFSGSISAVAVIVSRVQMPWAVAVLLYMLLVVVWFLANLNIFDRVFAFTRKMIASQVSPKVTSEICVVSADEVIRHSLIKYSQDLFSFHFCSRHDEHPGPGRFAVVVVNNKFDNRFEADLALARQAASFHMCPAILLTHGSNMPADQKATEPVQGVILLKKPIYVPALMKKLDSMLSGGRYVKAFEHIAQETQRIRIIVHGST